MKRSARVGAVGVILMMAFAVPAGASAQAVSRTVQVLPPGSTTQSCQPLVVQGVVAHVRNGSLHSFDVTVSDPSYVAILAQAGTDVIPFNYASRFNHGGGVVRHHIDVQTTPIRSALPVSVTFLSSPAGQPTCLGTITFSIGAQGVIGAPGVLPAPSAPSQTPSHPTTPVRTGGTSAVKPTRPAKPATGTIATSTKPATTTPVQGNTDSTGVCAGNGAIQLWFMLLAIYVVIAALTALAKPPLAQRSVALPLALILVPLVLLLGLWYFAPLCRAAGWIPAVSIMIAIAALLVAFRDHNNGIKVISLPPAIPPKKPEPPAVSNTKPIVPAPAPTAPAVTGTPAANKPTPTQSAPQTGHETKPNA